MEETYVVNGVTYIVGRQFEPAKKKTTFSKRVKNYLKSDFADFTKYIKGDRITEEYVLTARKEK
ncbi:MAG: hypothetical protein J5850_04620 [Clostridia bacterium]|nr:hypothetical protein [Clostridia bacterium]